MKNKNILVLDTETAGNFSTPFIYDLGFIVYNTKNKKVLQKKSILLKEIFYNRELLATAYYSEKIPAYKKELEKGYHELKTIKKAFDCLDDTIKKYNIDEIYTYTFYDKKALNFMIEFYQLSFNIEKIEFFDIRAYFLKSLFDDNYKNFCETNNFITEKGFYQSTAEIAGRYIMNNPDYIEEHTALQDCKLELNILIASINNNKNLNFGDKLESVKTNNLKVKNHTQKDIIMLDGTKMLEINYTSKREYKKNNTIYYKTT